MTHPLEQLVELTQAMNQRDVVPVICGGLAVYILHRIQSPQEESSIRVTNDIDIVVPQTQAEDSTCCRSIAEVILDELSYVVDAECRHFRFQREHDSVDILAPPVNGIESDTVRVKLVKSRLHGRVTPDAAFIHEDLQTVELCRIAECQDADPSLRIAIPSLTHLLIMKLLAFSDRNTGDRENPDRARAHAWDIFTIISCASVEQFQQSRNFLQRHNDWDILHRTRQIVKEQFSSPQHIGWHRAMENDGFLGEWNVSDKTQRIDEQTRRLLRWFDVAQ